VFRRFGIAVLALLVLVAGLAGVVLAQDPAPPPTDLCPYGGTCGGYGSGRYGMGGYGYAGSMPTLLAEALGMTVEELNAAQAAGQTVAEIAAVQGVELADVVAAVLAPHAERLAQSVADGYLTQEQADSMLAAMTEHMTWRLQTLGTGYGSGCGMIGRGGYAPPGSTGDYGWRGHHGGMRGGRWSVPQAPVRQAPASDL
jgi:hypothetical protein